MSADEIYQRLQGLKLFGMAALCDELLAHRERPLPSPEQRLKRMIEADAYSGEVEQPFRPT